MKQTKPVVYVIFGVLVMLLAGFVYAWSILSAPIAAEFPEWSASQLSLAFTLCMAFFCLGGMFNGYLVTRINPRWTFRISVILFIVGFFMASRVNSLPMLYISYGVICGTASGFSYNTVMATVPRWYPHCQGLVSGILLMGFGFSTLIVGRVFSAITPDAIGAWRNSLLIMGIVMGAVILICSFILRKPKEGEVTPPAGVHQQEVRIEAEDLSPAQMLGTITFWVFFIWEILLSSGGLNIISQSRMIAQESSTVEISLATMSLFVGMISVFNGVGRVVFGAIFDRKGRKVTMTIVSIVATLAVVLITAALKSQTLPLMIVAFMLLGLSYGGGPVMSAAFTKAQFGMKYFSMNFSVMTLCLLVASFGSQLLTTIYVRLGENYGAVMPIIIGCMAATIILGIVLPDRHKK